MKQTRPPLPFSVPPLRETLKDIAVFVLGTLSYSVGVAVFTAPNKIAPGGITGIATILHYVIGTPIGTMIMVLNIPLFLVSFRTLGKRFLVKTVFCTVLVSVFTDVLSLSFVPKYTNGNILLAVLYGGVLSGAGLGLVFLRGGTTGGTDILSRLLRRRWPQVPMGRMMLAIDFCMVSASALVFWPSLWNSRRRASSTACSTARTTGAWRSSFPSGTARWRRPFRTICTAASP